MTMKSLLGILALTALATTGCAQLSAGFDDAGTYQCLEHRIDADVLAAETPIGDLTGDAATMLAEAKWDDGSALVLEEDAGWYLAAQGDESILVMRTLSAEEISGPRDFGLPGSNREVVLVQWLEGAPNAADGWYVWANSYCPLTIDLGGLEVPIVALDPAHKPSSDATDLQLLVTEVACNSGQPADGRVKLVSLVETEDSVTVTIGVKPNSGTATCPSNPATPFTVELADPLGDRTIIDGTRGEPLAAP